MPDREKVDLQAIELRVLRPFDPKNHQRTCRPSEIDLEFTCVNCGHHESAEQMEEDVLALLQEVTMLRKVLDEAARDKHQPLGVGCKACDETVAHYRRVLVERDAYREALHKYGKHKADCKPGGMNPMENCTCGFLATLL